MVGNILDHRFIGGRWTQRPIFRWVKPFRVSFQKVVIFLPDCPADTLREASTAAVDDQNLRGVDPNLGLLLVENSNDPDTGFNY